MYICGAHLRLLFIYFINYKGDEWRAAGFFDSGARLTPALLNKKPPQALGQKWQIVSIQQKENQQRNE